MVDVETAQTEVRKLAALKDYPRSWGESDPVRADQQTHAEAALIQAAIDAPDGSSLRRFTAEWMRRNIDAPKPADLYAAWRGPDPEYRTPRTVRCRACGDTGWRTRYIVCDAMTGRNAERFEITEDQVDAMWEKIRAAGPRCAQRVYDEAVRCNCTRPTQERDRRAVDGTRAAAGDHDE